MTAARRTLHPDKSAMATAFLAALRNRVERGDSRGQVMLPTGKTKVADVGRVLKAIDRARDEEDR